MKTYTIKAEFEITDQRIEDLLSSFFRGSNWVTILASDIHVISKQFDGQLNLEKLILLGASIPFYEKGTINYAETMGHKNKVELGCLNMENMILALNAMAIGEDLKGNKRKYLKKHFKDFITEKEDNRTADVVIQIAVMNEIVFA